MGLDVTLISGDARAVVDSVASATGVDKAVWEASPVDKKNIMDSSHLSGRPAMMVGDGINDSPALTAATLGVAMAGVSDITLDSADVVLTRNDVELVALFLRVSKKSYAIMKENIFWALFYNVIAIPLAVSGVLHPIVAAGAMAASSVFVVANSLRISRISEKGGFHVDNILSDTHSAYPWYRRVASVYLVGQKRPV